MLQKETSAIENGVDNAQIQVTQDLKLFSGSNINSIISFVE